MNLPFRLAVLCGALSLVDAAPAQTVLTDPFTHEGGAAGTLTSDPNAVTDVRLRAPNTTMLHLKDVVVR